MLLAIAILFNNCKEEVIAPSSISGDNYLIAFNHYHDVFVYNTLSKSLKQITNSIVDTSYYAWISGFSRNGEELFFTLDYMTSGKEDLMFCKRDDIFAYKIISGEINRITNTVYQEKEPILNPISNKIFFLSNESGISEIYSMNKDGNNKIKLTSNSRNKFSLSISPSGLEMIYTYSQNNSKSNIYLNNIDGNQEINLSNSVEEESNPVFFPDGQSILYNYYNSSTILHNEIFKLDLRTKTRTNITNGSKNFKNAKISSDAKYIICWFDDGAWIYCYLMDINGDNQIQLGKVFDYEFTPDAKYVIYSSLDGLHKYDITNKTDEVILNQQISGFNIEVAKLN